MARGPADRVPQIKTRKTPRKPKSAEAATSANAKLEAALAAFPVNGTTLSQAVQLLTTEEHRENADAQAAAQPDNQLPVNIGKSTALVNQKQLVRSICLFVPILQYFRQGVLSASGNEHGNTLLRKIEKEEWMAPSWTIVGDFYYVIRARHLLL